MTLCSGPSAECVTKVVIQLTVVWVSFLTDFETSEECSIVARLHFDVCPAKQNATFSVFCGNENCMTSYI